MPVQCTASTRQLFTGTAIYQRPGWTSDCI